MTGQKMDASPIYGNQNGIDTLKQGVSSSTFSNSTTSDVFNNLSNQQRGSDENCVAGIAHLSTCELQKELLDTRDKLKIVTQKFATVRKERDTLKQENKELQDEVMQL